MKPSILHCLKAPDEAATDVHMFRVHFSGPTRLELVPAEAEMAMFEDARFTVARAERT